ncbi:MAG TPA: RluA family pseudouridine synthase [Microvirga sp.]|nr:RluA family pseudouridine synthase [Microvirga sp.]
MKKSSSGQNGARSGRSGARQGFRSREDKPARKGPSKGAPTRERGAKPAGKSRVEEARHERPAAKAPARAADARRERPAAKAPTRPTKVAARPAAEAPNRPTRAQAKAEAQEVLATGVQTLVVEPDEADMRVDRFLVARFPQLAFTHIQRIVRKGELRVDGKRAQPNDRLTAGQKVRIPPLKLDQPRPVARSASKDQGDLEFLKSITLYEDKDVLIINKPMGLAVQGGSGTTRHVDGLLECMRDAEGQKPRLVHRLDKDTAGCLVIAKTRFAASTMAKSFRSRTTRKIYWALVAGVPRVRQGRVSTYLAKEGEEGDARMKVARHGDEGASHALTYYAVIDTAAQKLSWLSLKPVTGRTHQLRAHTAHIGHPIVGDPKYFDIENWELPGGIQNKLHLLARRIVIAHPRTGKPIDVTAPLPPHMQQSFNLLGFDTTQYDPIVEAPEE